MALNVWMLKASGVSLSKGTGMAREPNCVDLFQDLSRQWIVSDVCLSRVSDILVLMCRHAVSACNPLLNGTGRTGLLGSHVARHCQQTWRLVSHLSNPFSNLKIHHCT